MKTENKISVVINTYNAEKFLREVLEAVKGFDEIVICDMESQDSTVSIAQEYGCRVVTFPKKDHYIVEPARQFAIQSASFHWVLVVDADEIVTPELREYLYRRIAEADCPQGLYIPRHNRFMNRLKRGAVRDYQLRFFVREGTEWPPYIHTFPKVNGRVEKILDGGRKVCFVHLIENYLYETVEKVNRYTDGEVEKRADRNYGVGALLWRPAWRFVRSYFIDGNIRNGVSGFIDSVVTAFYHFLVVAKIIEKRIRQQTENKKR